MSCLIGAGLIFQGASGIKGCGHNTIKKAKSHASRGKKCLALFGVLYLIKTFIDVSIIAELGENIEMKLDIAPELAEEHNKVNNNPHVVLMYQNGTVLFNEKQQYGRLTEEIDNNEEDHIPPVHEDNEHMTPPIHEDEEEEHIPPMNENKERDHMPPIDEDEDRDHMPPRLIFSREFKSCY